MKVTEEEIRPEKIFNEYLKLAEQDVITYFSNSKREEISCPSCNQDGRFWAEKSGFTYKICENCTTIFVSPRPEKKSFDEYYTDSPSTKYWATTFYSVTESARREKLWKPKAQLVKDRIEKFQEKNKVKHLIDIGGGYGIFDEEIIKILDINPIIIEPSIHLANICRDKGLSVIEKFMEDINEDEFPSGTKCFVSFELFEHLYNPTEFLKTVYNSMKKNDLFIFTTLSGIGLDIQVLGANAKALSPPHHLNFFSPKSANSLLNKLGFEVLEAITPGKLDLDILKNNQEFIKDEFWKNTLKYLSISELETLQEDISKSGLSSHMMITCKKP